MVYERLDSNFFSRIFFFFETKRGNSEFLKKFSANPTNFATFLGPIHQFF
jgi:hypothetical protein